ncbi:hypothetical protein LOX64_26640 [Klebsiella pneumoniae]|nr:hypothetical protein LOX64_26640 [Klebsiella pneumoniae]
MGFFSFLRKISNKEKGVVIYEKQWFSLLEKVSAFDEVRQWAESNGGAYYPLLECRRLTDSENVRKSEDILNRLEFIDRRFREFISIMSWICPYISRHLSSLNPLLARCRRYSRGER